MDDLRPHHDNSDAFADDEGAPVVGVGEAADGLVRALFAAEDRLTNLEIAQELLRHSRNGGRRHLRSSQQRGSGPVEAGANTR